jgi:hypothetical protein
MDVAVDRLEVRIIQARGLKLVTEGAPTPYVEVDVGPDSFRTRHLVETTDPIWNSQTMTFMSLLAHEVDQIIFKVKHKDIFSGKDLILGVAAVSIGTYYSSPKVEVDGWFDLIDTSESAEGGGIVGKIRAKVMYFNELDEDLLESYSAEKLQAPNLLEVCTTIIYCPILLCYCYLLAIVSFIATNTRNAYFRTTCYKFAIKLTCIIPAAMILPCSC